MTREELAGKNKQDLVEIARALGIKSISKLNRDDLIEQILLLDPPFSANPVQEMEISQHLQNILGGSDKLAYQTATIENHYSGVTVDQEQQEATTLPEYDDTRIALMVRDPYWLYTYWSINGETKNFISNHIKPWHQIQLVLRVHDITNLHNFTGTESNYFFDVNIGHDIFNWYINVNGPNRTFCVDLGFIQDNGLFYTIARSNFVTTPRDNISEVIDEEWMSIEKDYQNLYRLGGGILGNSSAELVESLISRLEKEMGSGAVSSFAGPAEGITQKRKFWLVVNTELIVYGATEPDASVFIQGEPIKLRPDGSFTLRFALPDGTQEIPVTGHSADGVDNITITPIVNKKTI